MIAFAADEYSLSNVVIEYNSGDNSVKVSGYVQTDKTDLPMTLLLKNSSGDILDFAECVATTKNEKGLYFEFAALKFNAASSTGTYDFYVSGRYVSETKYQYQYKGTEELFTIVYNLVTKINADDVGYLSDIQTYGDMISLDYSWYNGFSDSGKEIFQSLMNEKQYLLDARTNYATVLEADNAMRSVMQQLVADFNGICIISQFASIDSNAKFDTWFNEHNGIFDSVKSDKIYKDEFLAQKGKTKFIEHLVKLTTATSNDSVFKKCYEAALLTVIETEHNSKTLALVYNYPNMFNFNKENYGKLSSENDRQQVVVNAAEKPYDSLAKFDDKINELINAKLNPGGGSNQGNGGGGGGGGSSDDLDSLAIITPNIPQDKPTESFSDLSEAVWAKEAIVYLSDNGIVSGYDGKFMPNNNITRAEFAKILVDALGLSLTEESKYPFNDVCPRCWYAPYVNTARNAEIFFGDENGNFLPEALISRQDMAVSVYRAFKYAENVNGSFADENDIANYAKTAIKTLAAHGVISGKGENNFCPLDNSTRAEAASIIYRIIK